MSAASKPCQHKRARHQHGTRAAYVADRCPCEPCRQANRAYENGRSRQITYGRWSPYVDAAPAREHIRACMAAGIGTRRICEISGVSRSAVIALLYGKQRAGKTPTPSARIRPEVSAKLLAVRVSVDNLAGRALIDATGTRRRLQALVAIGWSRAELGRRIGVTPQNFTTLMTTGRVTVRTAAAVSALYDEISMQPRTADDHGGRISISRARRSAAAAGWVPPLAWDDEDIDDPAAKPAGSVHYLADLRDPVAYHHRQGLNDRQVAAVLSRDRETIARIRHHLGLPAQRERSAA